MAKKNVNFSYLSSLEPKKIYEKLKLVWGLYKDERISKWQKMVLLVGVAYAVIPIDLIPDFIPGLGMVDDIIVLLLVSDWFIKLCPPDIVEEHRLIVQSGIGDFDEDFKTLVYMIKKEFKNFIGRRV